MNGNGHDEWIQAHLDKVVANNLEDVMDELLNYHPDELLKRMEDFGYTITRPMIRSDGNAHILRDGGIMMSPKTAAFIRSCEIVVAREEEQCRP